MAVAEPNYGFIVSDDRSVDRIYNSKSNRNTVVIKRLIAKKLHLRMVITAICLFITDETSINRYGEQLVVLF